jgi:hypothetical protein
VQTKVGTANYYTWTGKVANTGFVQCSGAGLLRASGYHQATRCGEGRGEWHCTSSLHSLFPTILPGSCLGARRRRRFRLFPTSDLRDVRFLLYYLRGWLQLGTRVLATILAVCPLVTLFPGRK